METMFVGIFFAIFLLIAMVFVLPAYLLHAFGTYRLAKRENINRAWLSFVPIGDQYVLGRLVDGVVFNFLRGFMPIVLILTSVFTFLSAQMLDLMDEFGAMIWIVLVLSLVGTFISFYSYYLLYKQYTKAHVLYFTLTVLSLGFLAPLFVFLIRNKDRVWGAFLDSKDTPMNKKRSELMNKE